MNNSINPEELPLIFTPDNEPYLGRKLLFHFDQNISAAMKQNSVTAPRSHDETLSEHQHMACQIIAQSLSLVLSIRELIRQGYLFGAHVLYRSLVERVTILFYLYLHPEDIEKWKQGWNHRSALSLAKMFDAIQNKLKRENVVHGYNLTSVMNSLVHGKPDSAPWNLVSLEGGKVGHAVSKILQCPDLCDDLCANMIPQLCILQAMMTAYFQKSSSNPQDAFKNK